MIVLKKGFLKMSLPENVKPVIQLVKNVQVVLQQIVRFVQKSIIYMKIFVLKNVLQLHLIIL
jgi:hypothetical protein